MKYAQVVVCVAVQCVTAIFPMKDNIVKIL